jgi:hypothetical protein
MNAPSSVRDLVFDGAAFELLARPLFHFPTVLVIGAQPDQASMAGAESFRSKDVFQRIPYSPVSFFT